jgi:heavy metal sensor kinase
MTLAGRLSAFFLAALAVILLGFSAALFVAAWVYLHRQLDDRLDASLDALAAAVEFSPGYVEWEPAERPLRGGRGAPGESAVWLVRDEGGRVVDQSPGADEAGLADVPPDAAPHEGERQGKPWRVKGERIPAKGEAGRALGDREYSELTLTAAVPLGPARATLAALAAALAVVSAALWLAAALLGRRLSRRALAPLTRMAAAARSMGEADRGRRLPDPATGDELEDLSVAFNGLLNRLQESFERQRRFTGDAAHQLRTPLAAVLGQVEVALLRERAADDYRRALALVRDKADDMRQLVEMLLYLARADAEARAPERQPLDLAAWLADHLSRWEGRPRAADLRLKDESGGPLWAETHAALLGQLLDNLLDNACKYSPAGSPITVRLARDGGAASLGVEDAGRGVPPEDLPHIFEPFYRSKEARSEEPSGVGLGLAVAARVAGALGGTLSVQSEAGRGSCFTLKLPRMVAAGGGA